MTHTCFRLFWNGKTATVNWDDGPILISVPSAVLKRLSAFVLQPAEPSPQPVLTLTTARLLRFQSIQDLLFALGYVIRRDANTLVNTVTTHMIGHDQIASRSVFEFVRWGLATAWLDPHVKTGKTAEGKPA